MGQITSMTRKLNELKNGAKSRATKKGLDFNLTDEYLETLYIGTQGFCPMTGIVMEWEAGTRAERNLNSVSLDRIDNSKGYVKGNVRLVSTWYNNARNHSSDEYFLKMAKAFVERSERRQSFNNLFEV